MILANLIKIVPGNNQGFKRRGKKKREIILLASQYGAGTTSGSINAW